MAEDAARRFFRPLGSHPRRSLSFLEPEERADTAYTLKLDFPSTARHDAAIAAPAGFVIQVRAVHVEILADLFDFAIVPGRLLIQDVE
jgi:hypothetical protein